MLVTAHTFWGFPRPAPRPVPGGPSGLAWAAGWGLASAPTQGAPNRGKCGKGCGSVGQCGRCGRSGSPPTRIALDPDCVAGEQPVARVARLALDDDVLPLLKLDQLEVVRALIPGESGRGRDGARETTHCGVLTRPLGSLPWALPTMPPASASPALPPGTAAAALGRIR